MIEETGRLFSYMPPAAIPQTVEELLSYKFSPTILRCLPIYDQPTISGRLKMTGSDMEWARKTYHDLPYLLMQALDEHGLRPVFVKKYNLVGLPIGKSIREISLSLVDTNSKILRYYAKDWDYVILPRIETPYSSWQSVKQILEKNLPDDKFIAVHSYKDQNL